MKRYAGRVTLTQAQALANEGCAINLWNPSTHDENSKTWRLLADTQCNGRKAVCDEHGTVLSYTKTEALTALEQHRLIPSPDATAWRSQLLKRRNITCLEAVFLKERHYLRQYIVRQSTDQRAWVISFNPGKHRKTLSHDHTRKPIRFHRERDAHAAAHLIGFSTAAELAKLAQ